MPSHANSALCGNSSMFNGLMAKNHDSPTTELGRKCNYRDGLMTLVFQPCTWSRHLPTQSQLSPHQPACRDSNLQEPRSSKREETMAIKANFTADEWKVILSSPALAGMAVTLAEPSGIWGMMKEGMASGSALLEAKGDPGASELAKALVAAMETSEGRSSARDGLKSELTGKSLDSRG
jgi:hypothetical protein